MAPLELRDARPNGACIHGNAHLWVISQLGAGRALQLILVLSSLCRSTAQAAKARDYYREKLEEPQRRPAPARKNPARCSEARPRR